MGSVSLKNVTKIFPGNVVAVKNFTLDVQNGEFVVLVGPSGCGKSTTLRCIAGLEEVTEGIIEINGQRVNDKPPKERGIAMVFQNYALYPHMTVYKNMAFGLQLAKMPRKQIEERVNWAADILQLKPLLDRKPKALSGGQRQRVAMGRAIVRHPEVFLFDEPLSNLDAKLRVEMRAEISKLHTRLKTTVIYVTHDQIEAMTMGDKIVVMRDGVIQQVADPITLYDKPINRFVAGFIGSPAMNFIDVKLSKEDSSVVATEVGGEMKIKFYDELAKKVEPYIGKEVTFGIRPEDIYIATEAHDAIHTAEVTAGIEVVEPMGSEQYIYVNTGRNSIIGRVGTRASLRVGEKTTILFDMEKCHIFDRDTENTIV